MKKLFGPSIVDSRLLVFALALACAVIPASASAADLQLEVAPKRADVGKKTCFTFTATRAGKPVGGAAVRFESAVGKSTRPDGEVRSCVTLDYPGAHGAVVEAGESKAIARVEATQPPGAEEATEEWHWTHPFVQGYDCNADWGKSAYVFAERARCNSGLLANPCCNPAPLPVWSFYLYWRSAGRSEISVKFDFPGGYNLTGTVPDRASDRFTVTDGFTPSAFAPIISGSDPTKRAGEKGGPLSIDAVFREDWSDSAGLTHSHYDFDIQGWLYYDAR